MLNQGNVVGMVQVADADRARAFYEGVLGLPLVDDGFALVASFPGARLRITTIPGYTASQYPAFGFESSDIAADVARLAAAGVTFERYAFLGEAQDEQGVWTAPDGGNKVAWFKDPDGNLLSISTHVG